MRLLACSILLLGCPALAHASPWTLPKGNFAARAAFDQQWATREYLIDGTYQAFPLRGRFFSSNLRLSLRYGITDRLEVGAEAALTHLEYQSDEIYFGAPVVANWDEVTSNRAIAEGITSLDRSVTGIGDLQFYARVKVTPKELWRFSFAPELHLKVPTGYRGPAGTFQDDVPGEVADDVSLGDGQLDVTALAHAGFVPVPIWFIRLSGGFRARFFGPGQQVVGSLKTGVRIKQILLPYGELAIEHSVTRGKVVGVSFATHAPETPAAEFTVAQIVPLEMRQDRSILTGRLGILLAQPKWEVDVTWSPVLWGNNVAQLQSIAVGVTFRP